MAKIVLISVGQPSTNPRLVKEADTLAEAGFDVIVIYSFWTRWAWETDLQLFKKINWKPILAGGSPFEDRFIYFLSRLRSKVYGYLARKTSFRFGMAEVARGRTYPELSKKAKSIKADLYIAHIQAALPAAVKAAQKNHTKCGFDAEDFHRQEVDDDVYSFYFRISKYIEDEYLPRVDYVSASSPLIAEQYTLLYKRPVTCLLNVFPKTPAGSVVNNPDQAIKLFWFSQTIGSGRGLETIIEAMGLINDAFELHLLGELSDGYKEQLLTFAVNAGVTNNKLFFYEPVMAGQLFTIAAQFDIGLASETGFCLNNKLALSNKIFTYIQSGLAVVASNTPAQSALLDKYPQVGKTYGDAAELSAILKAYSENRELLYQTKLAAFKCGQTDLNWENEAKKFLAVINEVLADKC